MISGELSREINGFGHGIFGWDIDIDYDLNSTEHKIDAKKVRQRDPLEDEEISELLFDMFCLVHSYNWCSNDDISEEQYRADVKTFKDKWFKRTPEERIESEIDKSLEEVRAQLYRDLLNQYGG